MLKGYDTVTLTLQTLPGLWYSPLNNNFSFASSVFNNTVYIHT